MLALLQACFFDALDASPTSNAYSPRDRMEEAAPRGRRESPPLLIRTRNHSRGLRCSSFARRRPPPRTPAGAACFQRGGAASGEQQQSRFGRGDSEERARRRSGPMNVNPNSQLSSTSVVDWQVKNPVDDDVIFSLERRGVNERSLSHLCLYSFFSLLFSSLPLLSAARSLRAARTR